MNLLIYKQINKQTLTCNTMINYLSSVYTCNYAYICTDSYISTSIISNYTYVYKLSINVIVVITPVSGALRIHEVCVSH